MTKNMKKREQSKESLKRLKDKLNRVEESKKTKERKPSCFLSFICKLFRKTN